MKTTFPFISAHLRTSRSRKLRRGSGGFTLIEMMVVVVIITILATIAIPSISRRMQMYQAKKDVEMIAGLFRGARLRAMGRGSAVLVRFDDGIFTVHEAVRGGTANQPGCQTMPESSCFPTARWAAADDRSNQIDTLDLANAAGVTATTVRFILPITGGESPARTELDICFTPMGSAYADMEVPGSLIRMTTAPRFDHTRVAGGGFSRSALITPLGTARVVATP